VPSNATYVAVSPTCSRTRLGFGHGGQVLQSHAGAGEPREYGRAVQLGALVAARRILGHVIDLRVDGHAPGSFTRPPGHLPVG
jgi:hypothetical protein